MSEYKVGVARRVRNIFHDRWVWMMAWRDARHNFSRLLLFTISLTAGIAAVVSLDSINQTLQTDINNNAKELLGADIVINANAPLEEEVTSWIDSVGIPQATETDMASMVLFLHNQQSRLIKLVAYGGPFPFYGQILTRPSAAYDNLNHGNYALLDESLASQYEVSSGDSLKLGNKKFVVAGVVSELPGGGGIQASFTPAVYIAQQDLDSTGLIQYGSRVNYKRYLKTTNAEQTETVSEKLEPLIKKYGHSMQTVEQQKESLGEAFLSIYRFFSLLAFIALILGCIGVASSVHIYAREKREEVAVLRCLGSTGWQAFNIYFIQIFLLGLIGSLLGVALGVGIQQLIPLLLKDVVPFKIGALISWSSIAMGMILGAVVSVLFSILPLVAVRFVPPLSVLRSDFEPRYARSKTYIIVIILIALFPMAFATFQTRSFITGVFFFLGLAGALTLLAGVSFVLLRGIKKFFPHRANFLWRHALSNLFRPNNQTRILVITIGLGSFIISTLNVVEESMLNQVEFTGRENQSNTILFDIQPHQREGIVQLMKDNHLKVNQVVPIITCRISELKGKSILQVQNDTTDKASNWALTREYRVTYRDTLHVSEELLEGEIQHKPEGKDYVVVTISDGMLDNLDVKLGDSLVFDVQGVPIKAVIGGVRKVDWPKDPPNFIFVFPSGVLEEAPQVYVTATRITNQEEANKFQRELVALFPNVSLIDLRLILSTLDDIFTKLGLIVRFLALFSLITGLVVLAGAVINSKYARIKENVLLRTIGARKSQIIKITLIEYAYLGLFSALTGMILSMGGGWLLTTFFFKITFAFDLLEMIIILFGVIFLTMFIGWWNSREVINTPPLRVLRKET